MNCGANKIGVYAHTYGNTDTQTDVGDDNARRSKLAPGKNRNGNAVHIIFSSHADPDIDKLRYSKRRKSHQNDIFVSVNGRLLFDVVYALHNIYDLHDIFIMYTELIT